MILFIIQAYINILLTLGFKDVFCKMSQTEKDKILNIGIGDDFKDIVKEIVNK